LAVKLIIAGHVRVNRKKISSNSKLIRVGDILTIALEQNIHVVRVLGLAQRREGYDKASQLYEALIENNPN